jgi:hypothetical protein
MTEQPINRALVAKQVATPDAVLTAVLMYLIELALVGYFDFVAAFVWKR